MHHRFSFFHIICFWMFVGISMFACKTPNAYPTPKPVCGYAMTADAFYAIQNYIISDANPYDTFNGSAVYSEINDTIRNHVADSIIFEIFLTEISNESVCVDVFIPNNDQFRQQVECAYMQATFSAIVPSHRSMRVFVYTNPNGTGDIPFKEAITNKKY